MAYGAREAIAKPSGTLALAAPHLARTAPLSATLQIPKALSKATVADEAPVLSSWVAQRPQTPMHSSGPRENESTEEALLKNHYYAVEYSTSTSSSSSCRPTTTRPSSVTAVTVREIDAKNEQDEEDASDAEVKRGVCLCFSATTCWVDGEESFDVGISGPVREAGEYKERRNGEEVLRLHEPEIVVIAAVEPLPTKRSEDGGAVIAAAVGIEFTLTCVDNGWSGGEVMFDDDFLFEEEIMDPDYFRKKDRQRESGCSVAAEC